MTRYCISQSKCHRSVIFIFFILSQLFNMCKKIMQEKTLRKFYETLGSIYNNEVDVIICETMASDKNRLGRRKVRVHTERDGRWSYTFTFSKGSHTGHNYKKIQCRLNRFIHIWTCFYSPLHRNIIWSVKAVSVLRIFVSLLLLLLLYTFLWNSRMTELRVHVRLWTLNNIIQLYTHIRQHYNESCIHTYINITFH